MNNFNIAGGYRNARIGNGVSGMSANNFGRVGVNRSNLIRAGSEDLRGAGLVRGRLGVTPGRESFRMADRQVHMTSLPQTCKPAVLFAKSGTGGWFPWWIASRRKPRIGGIGLAPVWRSGTS